MHDLNDLYYFVQIVDHQGLAPASRALGVPKSKLSRRLAALEARLDVRLVQRSTRHFTVTEIGREYYAHCRAMLVEAQAAQETIERTRSEPCGVIRLTCPVALLHARVETLLTKFMTTYPWVEVHLEATNRRVDVIEEGVDVALRARTPPLEDSELMFRVLGEAGRVLVASPTLLDDRSIAVPADLSDWPSLDHGPPQERHAWHLEGPDGAKAEIRHDPRLITDDITTLRNAAIGGVGVVLLPKLFVSEPIRRGELVRVLPDWEPRRHIVHAVYPSRRGLLPAVRALLDHLATGFPNLDDE